MSCGSRRAFMKSGALALLGLGSVPRFSCAPPAPKPGGAAEGSHRHFPARGGDGLSMVVPHGDPSYYALRGSIAVARPRRNAETRGSRTALGLIRPWPPSALWTTSASPCQRAARRIPRLALRCPGLHGVGHARSEEHAGRMLRPRPLDRARTRGLAFRAWPLGHAAAAIASRRRGGWPWPGMGRRTCRRYRRWARHRDAAAQGVVARIAVRYYHAETVHRPALENGDENLRPRPRALRAGGADEKARHRPRPSKARRRTHERRREPQLIALPSLELGGASTRAASFSTSVMVRSSMVARVIFGLSSCAASTLRVSEVACPWSTEPRSASRTRSGRRRSAEPPLAEIHPHPGHPVRRQAEGEVHAVEERARIHPGLGDVGIAVGGCCWYKVSPSLPTCWREAKPPPGCGTPPRRARRARRRGRARSWPRLERCLDLGAIGPARELRRRDDGHHHLANVAVGVTKGLGRALHEGGRRIVAHEAPRQLGGDEAGRRRMPRQDLDDAHTVLLSTPGGRTCPRMRFSP